MSKKNRKKNPTNINKKSDVKNKKFSEEEYKIWKQIMLFSIIFFPYALYLFIFKTNTSKYIKGFLIIIFVIFGFLIYDTVKYPDRVHNEVAFSHIQELRLENKTNMLEPYYIEKKERFLYKDEEYISYNIYDVQSMYYGIFKVKEYNKDYDLVYLYDMMKMEVINKNTSEFIKFKSLHPIVFVELVKNNIDVNNIDSIGDIVIQDIFKNSKKQSFIMESDEIEFEFVDLGIINIKTNGVVKYETKDNEIYNNMFPSVYKVLSRNFTDYEIVGYRYLNSCHIYNILVGDTKYVVEYYYNEGASLNSIDDEKVYLDSLKEKYELYGYKYE